MNFGNMGWGMGFGWIAGLLFIGMLFWLVFRTINSTGAERNEKETAKDILLKRFARGEISKDEFEEISKNLG